MPSGVKDVKFDNEVIDFEDFGEEVNAGSGFGIGEGVVNVLVEDGGFAGVWLGLKVLESPRRISLKLRGIF